MEIIDVVAGVLQLVAIVLWFVLALVIGRDWRAWNKKFRRLSDELEAIKEGANVVPVSELLEVRDALYYADQITLRGIGQLNVLIDKHAVRVEDGPVEEMRHE